MSLLDTERPVEKCTGSMLYDFGFQYPDYDAKIFCLSIGWRHGIWNVLLYFALGDLKYKFPGRLVHCSNKSPLQVCLWRATLKLSGSCRAWQNHRLDDRQHLDKKEPSWSWDKFGQPSVCAWSASYKITSDVEQATKLKIFHESFKH